jgi:penicillin-binding protein 1C
MVIFRQIVLLVLIGFIKLGDAVIYLIHQAGTVVSSRFSPPRPRRSTGRTAIKKSKTLYSARRAHPIHFAVSSIKKYCSSVIAKTIRSLQQTGKIVLAPFVHAYHQRHHPKAMTTKRRKNNIQKAIYKPSFLYKFKFLFLGVLMSFVFIFLPLLSIIFLSDLPNPSELSLTYIPKTTKIFDRQGVLLYEIYANQNRSVVKLSSIPSTLKQATIAVEDKDFYTHKGFDVRGILRALVSNLKANDLQGGSTITQQLIKSAFFTPEPSLKRKVKELVLAFWAERKYSKNQILEMYFNYVPYGGTAWGVESASEIYFGERVSELDLAQAAFLAGLPRAPSIYSPFSGSGNLWKTRQKEVLSAMVRDKYITQKQANDAFREELSFRNPDVPIKAPHFVMYVKDLLVQKYGISEVERGGLQIKTSLDYTLQQQVEKTVADEVEADSYLNIQNGAALVTSPSTGDILAMVGSRDYFDIDHDGNVNITTSLRQPGSTIKMVTYTLALENGFTEATVLDDSPLTIASSDGGPSYSPVNYDGAYHGRQTLRNSFANSFNIPAVRVAQKLGVPAIVDMGRKMGITTWGSPNRYGLSITLGSGETTMTNLATVYGTIANGGNKVTLNPILEVKDANGTVMYSKQVTPEREVSEGTSFIISDILADNNARQVEFGPNSPLHIPGQRVSVKTGTTDNKRDNWTIGFTKQYLVAAWVGNNDNTPMNPALASGITGAAPIWNKVFTGILADHPSPETVIVPESIVAKNCAGKISYFVRGTENSANCRFTLPVTPTPQTQ